MPPTPLLIVVGPPASGKTGLARRLAVDLRLPLLSRDDFKECLFDTLGSGWRVAGMMTSDTPDREWSKRLGMASYALLWQALETNLSAGVATIVENNFLGERPAALPRTRRASPLHRPTGQLRRRWRDARPLIKRVAPASISVLSGG